MSAPFSISVTSDIKKLQRALENVASKQVPFAAAMAINQTARDVIQAERHEMKDVFDRPTPYTLDALYMKPANKGNLEATVGIKDFSGKGIPASKFLSAQILGGSRGLKRSEKALAAVGALPPGYRIVPGGAANLDQFGNIDRGLLVQLISYFQAFPEMGYKANMTVRRRKLMARGNAKKGIRGVVYFVGRPGGGKGPLGIWARYAFASGSAVRPVLIFAPHANYEAIFDFFYVGQKTVERRFPINLNKAFSAAMLTAK